MSVSGYNSNKKWIENNREYYIERRQKYYLKNKEKLNAESRRRNKEITEGAKKYRASIKNYWILKNHSDILP